MKKGTNAYLLKIAKCIANKQINDTIDGRCLFLCYQPKIPKNLKKRKVN